MSFFAQKIIEGQHHVVNESRYARSYSFDTGLLTLKKIVTLLGPRRAGKTTIMIQWINQLIDSGHVHLEQIVFLDYVEFGDGPYPSYDDLLREYHTLFPDKTPRFFLDEIQTDPTFKVTLLTLLNKGYKIFVTGSNSTLLSSELATQLRGRNFEYTIRGLSFKEYCLFQGIQREDSLLLSEQKGLLAHTFNQYLQWGTYPEIALTNTLSIKRSLIEGYMNTLLFRDLQDRYGKSVVEYVDAVMEQHILSNTKHVNIHKLYQALKSQGKRVSKDKLYGYSDLFYWIFFAEMVGQYWKPKGLKKSYLYDRGYMNLFSQSDNLGQKRESCVYHHLRLQGKQPEYALFGTNEIDFITDEEAIQVCYDLNSQNSRREFAGFESDYVQGKKKVIYVVTMEDSIVPEGIEVRTWNDLL